MEFSDPSPVDKKQRPCDSEQGLNIQMVRHQEKGSDGPFSEPGPAKKQKTLYYHKVLEYNLVRHRGLEPRTH